MRKYEEFRRRFEDLRTSCEDSRRNFLALERRLNEDFKAFKAEDERRIDQMLFPNQMRRESNPDDNDYNRRRDLILELEMEIQQAFRTQFAPEIEVLQDWKTELENCEGGLKKLLSNDDSYMRIMRKRGIGPYTPWLAALDGEYLRYFVFSISVSFDAILDDLYIAIHPW